MFLRVMEVAGLVLLLAFIVTQLLYPAIKGRRLFPLFRMQGKLERAVADIEQSREEERLARKITKATKEK